MEHVSIIHIYGLFKTNIPIFDLKRLIWSMKYLIDPKIYWRVIMYILNSYMACLKDLSVFVNQKDKKLSREDWRTNIRQCQSFRFSIFLTQFPILS